MLIGQREGEREVFRSPRVLPDKVKGLTLVEVLVVAFILVIIFTALFLVLNIGNLANTVSGTKLELQQDVRRVIDWIAKDVRQSIGYEIASSSNNPSNAHLRFNLWTWDYDTNTWLLSDNFIEYEYDANLERITRRLIQSDVVQQTWEFNNIIEAPFYTRYDETDKEFIADDFRNNRRLIVVITGRRQARGALDITFTLKEEVKIRNG